MGFRIGLRVVVLATAIATCASTGLSPVSAAAGKPTKAEASDQLPLLPSAPLAGHALARSHPGTAWTQAQSHGRPIRRHVTPVKELPERRNATTRVFRNSDGSLTVDAYTTPINYRTEHGWSPIDNTIHPLKARPGWVGTSANSWTASFGPFADGVKLNMGKDSISLVPSGLPETGSPSTAKPDLAQSQGTKKSRTLATVAARPATPAASSLSFSDAWPHVDVRDTVTATSLAEDFILKSPEAGASFPLRVIGALVQADGAGGLILRGLHGSSVHIPAPTVADRKGQDVSRAASAQYVVEPGEESGTALRVQLDARWLRSAEVAHLFPLTIDPLVQLLSPTNLVNYSSSGGSNSVNPIRLGVDSSGAKWRAAAYFNQYEAYLNQGYRVYDAFVNFHFPDLAGTFPVCTPSPCPSNSPVTQVSVYDQGSAQPASFTAIGSGLQPVKTITDDNSDTYVYDADAYIPDVLDDWVTHNESGRWLGFTATEGPISTGGPTVLKYYDVRLTFDVRKPPAASVVTNLVPHEVLTTTTPTLQAQAIPLPDDSYNWAEYEYQITTGSTPGTGLVVSSGELDDVNTYQGPPEAPSWQVPEGTLQEGVTYYAWVLTDWYANLDRRYSGDPIPETVPPASWGVPFTVKLGLGSGGPSPTDAVGSVPGQTSTPSQGSPNPGLPGAKVTVNLVDGNASVSVGTPMLQTVSGGLSLGFTYNSLAVTEQGSQGLQGTFYNDSNQDGKVDSGDVMVGERIDPTV